MSDLDSACQVPLLELLRSVPKDARKMIEESQYSHRNIPYGRMCHEAADEIERLQQAECGRLRADVERHRWLQQSVNRQSRQPRRSTGENEMSPEQNARFVSLRNRLSHASDDLITHVDSLIAEAIAAEREACAKVCDNMPINDVVGNNDQRITWPAGAPDCVAAIRARKL